MAVAVEVADSNTLADDRAAHVDLPAGATLELRAADGARPTLVLDGELSVTGDASSTFILNGFLVAAGAAMVPASPPATPAALVHRPGAPTPTAPQLLGELNSSIARWCPAGRSDRTATRSTRPRQP